MNANKNQGPQLSRFYAREFYRKAMPPLCGYDNICDFIACVAHGVLIEVITEKSASKLLYAAQIALCTVRRKSKKRTISSSKPQKNQPVGAETPTPPPCFGEDKPQLVQNKRLDAL